MEDLRALQATCHFMRRVCHDAEVDRLISFERFDKMYRDDPDGIMTSFLAWPKLATWRLASSLR